MTLEQAQIFFYIVIPSCLIILTLTITLSHIIVFSKLNKILNKISFAIEEVEGKIKFFKIIFKELKSKLLNLDFYTKKAQELADNISDIKEEIKSNFEQTQEQEDEDDFEEEYRHSNKNKTKGKAKSTNKKTSKSKKSSRSK